MPPLSGVDPSNITLGNAGSMQMSLSNEFWLGTALAIPLGVAASALSFFIEPLLNAISKTLR